VHNSEEANYISSKEIINNKESGSDAEEKKPSRKVIPKILSSGKSISGTNCGMLAPTSIP
jgi:hypothetical protein